MDLSKALSQPETEKQTATKQFDSIIGRDDTTGKTYLKIPVPRQDVLNNIFLSLSNLLSKIPTL